MTSNEIRERFIKFFEKRGHAIIPSAPLVPENDTSVLFNTAGMQPLVPYLLGNPHPMGKRLVNVQKCVRTQDIEEVGDNTHDTFFEMLGNWSLGDYFKSEAIKWSFELLTNKEEGFGLDPKRLYVTCFEGNKDAPKDIESYEIWKKYLPENRIYFLGWNGKKEPNWWEVGADGPCGPDTEMFYDVTEDGLGDMTKEEYLRADDEQKVVEVWNDVFMEYIKKDGAVLGKLPSKNVDTGSGLERIVMAVQGKNNIFDTDLFEPIMKKINDFSVTGELKSKRIVADHVRTSVFMISDGVVPSNTERGYILRRLLRRAIRHGDKINLKQNTLHSIAETVILNYQSVYPDLKNQEEKIKNEISKEEEKFRTTLVLGLKEFEKGIDPFVLFTTYGFPIELTIELAQEKGSKIDIKDFNKKMSEHQKLSQTASAGMFKGGLANHNDKTIKLHTAHHLLLAALQETLGKEVKQRGSNITEERLRIDFIFSRKMTEDEKSKVELLVNQKIQDGLSVNRKKMSLSDAMKLGAEMEFGAKYPEVVSVYFIEDKNGYAVSKEFCGGPHVANTNTLGKFKILKEEAVSAGVRRIKAVLQ